MDSTPQPNILPLARIKTIMKSSPDALQISHEAVFAMTKAVEFFIEFLAQNSYEEGKSGKRLEYGDVAKYVKSQGTTLEFLSDILPTKITFKEAMEQIAAAEDSDSD